MNSQNNSSRRALSIAMNLSLAAGVLMLVLKTGAYILTGSAAVLSDAAESVVHLAAVVFAACSLRLSYRPADEDHLYGHAKISFFSAGFEGAMIILAALYIIFESVKKWILGPELDNLGAGTILVAVAAAVNGALGGYLLLLGRRKNSLIIEANGRHVLTDCWTSAGVLAGLGLVHLTGWAPFDPICGIIMALNILYSGIGLIGAAFGGLMDRAEPRTHQALRAILDRETSSRGISYHELRHRNLGDAHHVEVHLLFPDGRSLKEAHRIATAIEGEIESGLDRPVNITTHLECASDHGELHPGPPPPAGSNPA